jgi:Glycosyl transferases group 1
VNGVLLLHYQPPTGRRGTAATISEHVSSFRRHSRFPVWEVNTENPMPRGLIRFDFSAIVLHYSLFVPTWYALDHAYRELLRSSDSYKIAFFQDEMRHCEDRFWFLDEFGVDCVYTCLEPSEFDAVYGSRTRVPTIRTNIPGYVDEALTAAADRFGIPDGERTVDVGYRARPLPPWMGRGALEKTEIGRRFAELAAESGLVLDIGLEEEDRLYGDDWYRFMANCRGMLGVESGVSAFDLDDRARHQYEDLVAGRGPGAEVTIEELERGALGEIDGRIRYRTISPRHFEAAAFGVCQILFEGRYSGAMEPGVHYLPLRKDFSNLDEVIERFRDPAERERITSAARRDLIDSGDYSYRSFVEGFDAALAEAGLRPEVDGQKRAAVDRAANRWRRLRDLRAAGARLDARVARRVRAWFYWLVSRRTRA